MDTIDLRPQAEDRLRSEAEQRLHDFATLSGEWFWEQDADLRFSFISEGGDHAAMVNPSAYLGGTRAQTCPIELFPGDLARHEADLQARRPFRDFRFARMNAVGEARYFRVSGVPIFDEAGDFRGYRGTARDETDLHHFKVLKAKSDDLTRAKYDADLANRAKSNFLAVISHEVRTPLNSIVGFAEILNDQLFGPIDSARYRQYIANIHTSSLHLTALINDLLDMAKLEANAYGLMIETIRVAEVVADSCLMVTGLAERKTLRMQADAVDATLAVQGDRRAIQQVLINLLANAIKFTPEGGSITIQTVADLETGEAAVVVTDSGRGIPADLMARIGEPFLRVDPESYQDVGGAGLGLAISKALAEAMRGSLNISSAQGVGTVAALQLPLSAG